jgi:hypothetical protein
MRQLDDLRNNIPHKGCSNYEALELCDEIERLRVVFRVNILRLNPLLSHAEIDRILTPNDQAVRRAEGASETSAGLGAEENDMNDFSKETDITKSVALALAAAYWRGRLHAVNVGADYDAGFEAMIAAAARADMGKWIAVARGHETPNSK